MHGRLIMDQRPRKRDEEGNLLKDARVYLSGPMDFVASREEEKNNGWRNRVGQVLRDLDAVVFDPWNKPEVMGLHEYGREGTDTTKIREDWTFEDSPEGAERRAGISGQFWQTLHIDLRMVDTSDFTIAYCPTNIYSVGTPHEIATARLQRKPVLFVSPPVDCEALKELRAHCGRDSRAMEILDRLEKEVPIKPNPEGLPSLWYMPLVGGESFFDGFGFTLPRYRERYKWETSPLDEREMKKPPTRPLLPFLERVNEELPKKWDNKFKRYIRNDDWLLLKEIG
jgi:hypothetical protein